MRGEGRGGDTTIQGLFVELRFLTRFRTYGICYNQEPGKGTELERPPTTKVVAHFAQGDFLNSFWKLLRPTTKTMKVQIMSSSPQLSTSGYPRRDNEGKIIKSELSAIYPEPQAHTKPCSRNFMPQHHEGPYALPLWIGLNPEKHPE